MRPNPFLLRLLALLTVFLTVLVTIAVGRRVPIGLTAGVAFAGIGLGLHAVAGELFDREGNMPLVRAGFAYPVLSLVVGGIWVWQKVSVPLALLLIFLAIAVTVYAGAGRRPQRPGVTNEAVERGAVRWGLLGRPGWEEQTDTAPLRRRWPGRRTPRPFAAVAGEVDGHRVVVLDTVQDIDGRTSPVTVWVVELPVALPRTRVLPWLAGEGPVPASSDELSARADSDPEEVLVASAFINTLFIKPPWEPVVLDPGEITADRLIPEGDDPAFAWDLFTAEVRVVTAAGGLAGWVLVGRDLVLSRPVPEGAGTDWAATIARRLVALVRALPSEVVQRHGTAVA